MKTISIPRHLAKGAERGNRHIQVMMAGTTETSSSCVAWVSWVSTWHGRSLWRGFRVALGSAEEGEKRAAMSTDVTLFPDLWKVGRKDRRVLGYPWLLRLKDPPPSRSAANDGRSSNSTTVPCYDTLRWLSDGRPGISKQKIRRKRKQQHERVARRQCWSRTASDAAADADCLT